MKTRVAHAASTALLTSSLLVLSAFAQECDRDFYVASQDDLTDISSNCSTIHGSIFINGTYNDPFILSGITNITRSILVAWWNDAPVPQIPTVELRDLRYIDSIELPFLVASNFSAPDLETVKSLRLGQAKAGSEALLPSLRFGDTVSVIGNYSRIVLDSLERANTSLNICTMPYCDEEFGKSIIDRPLNVTLPSLVAANRLTIATKASIVSAPKLVSIADFSDIQSQQLRLQLPEAPVSISFPMLEVLNGSLEVDGAIESIDLPSLLNTSKSINIATSHPLNLSLPLVSSSAYIALIGELESVDLPNLESIQNMHIRSTLPLDCGPLDDRFGDGGRDAGYYYDCESASESRGSRLLMQGNAAVGVVFGVVGSMNLLGLGLW